MRQSNAFLYGLTVLIWGSTWLAIEYQLGEIAPEVSVFYRYAAAGALLFLWSGARRLPLKFPLRAHMFFMGLGACLFCLNYIVTYYAQQYISSALTAIVFSTMLWMNMGNARLFFGVRGDRQLVLGSIVGIAGIVCLFMPSMEASLSNATLLGGVLCLIGAFLASLGNMVSQAAQREALPVVQSNAYGMLYGAIFTGAIAAMQGQSFSFDSSLSYVLSLAYLVVFGSILGFWAYLTLLGRIGAHKAGYAMVTFPLVAMLLSVIFEDLTITPNLAIGAALVIVGNLLVLRRRENAPQPAEGEVLVDTR
ncbi:MAG: EamA family transporter [Pseudomonadota bacterium]